MADSNMEYIGICIIMQLWGEYNAESATLYEAILLGEDGKWLYKA